MIKQKTFILNPKGKTISATLGVDEKTADSLIIFARDTYRKNKSVSDAMTECHKKAKTQGEFLFLMFLLGIEKGEHIGLEKAAKITAHELAGGLIGKLFGGNKNDSFWQTLDAIVFVTVVFALIANIINFPHNWAIIPFDVFLLITILWRRRL